MTHRYRQSLSPFHPGTGLRIQSFEAIGNVLWSKTPVYKERVANDKHQEASLC
jgi:hypothetical protein